MEFALRLWLCGTLDSIEDAARRSLGRTADDDRDGGRIACPQPKRGWGAGSGGGEQRGLFSPFDYCKCPENHTTGTPPARCSLDVEWYGRACGGAYSNCQRLSFFEWARKDIRNGCIDGGRGWAKTWPTSRIDSASGLYETGNDPAPYARDELANKKAPSARCSARSLFWGSVLVAIDKNSSSQLE